MTKRTPRPFARDLHFYMGLPYTFEFSGSWRHGWFGKVKELPGCMSQGQDVRELEDNMHEAMELWLEVALEDGDPIPEPTPQCARGLKT